MSALPDALAALPPAFRVRFGVPDAPGWCRLGELDVAAWCGDGGAPAGAAVGEQLSGAVLGRVTVGLVLHGQGWDVGDLAVHRHELGFVDEVAVVGPAVLGAPDVIGTVAAAAVTTLDPLFAAVRAATRYGLVPLWNGAADAVHATATHLPLFTDVDPDAAQATASALVSALGARVRGTIRIQPVGRHRVAVRSACCLLYTSDPGTYCTTCPHLDDDERARRFASY